MAVVKIKDRRLHVLFPTPIWEFMFENCEALNESLHTDIVSFDWEAYKRERNLNYGEDLDSRSEDTYIPPYAVPAIAKLLKFALECGTEAARDYGWDLETHQMEVQNFWANVNRPNDYNIQHNHAPNHLSGVYYIHVPPGSGKIRFLDERRLRLATSPDPVRGTELTECAITFQPVPGMMLIFPAWLDHMVGQNKSSEIRTAVSFNLDLVQKPS